jgi:hypothetical protein
VAVQLARWENNGKAGEALRRADELMLQQPIAEQIRFFVEFGGMKNLKCYQVESELASNMWASSAKLQRNRYVDRQHAAVALPYCDVFVTDDRDLIKRCDVVRKALPFATAEVQRGEQFIRRL